MIPPAVLLLVAVACGDPDQPAPGAGDPTASVWELVSGTVDGEAIPMVESHPITLSFDDGSVGGTAACNSYFGDYTISDDGSISVAGLGQTEMACSPEEVMVAERLYLDGLSRIDSWAGDDDGSLTLSGEGVELRFAEVPPVPTASLTGTVWVLESLVEGDAVSSVSAERAMLEFFADGSLIGSTGCRTLAGSYVVSGPQVVVVELTAEGDCPADLADQDQHVLEVLGDAFDADIEGGQLTISSAGELGLVYRAEG